MEKVFWNITSTPRNLKEAIKALSDYYPLHQSKSAKNAISFEHIGLGPRQSQIVFSNEQITIRYTDMTCALRALGTLLSAETPRASFESTAFDTVGVMIDCSRNAVKKVSYLKQFFIKLALLGYNQVYLYIEDTYELPNESYFGYVRGAYTREELRELDDYAHKLGIELIACIQTLGHLEQILRWDAYSDVRDTSSVLLIDQKKTYELIDKMIRHFAQVFRSRRIHIGMDEAHDMGRGRYQDMFGHKSAFDLFNRHLDRVTKICMKYGLKPLIWSDMFFRIGSKTNDYYDPNSRIPKKIRSQISQSIELVYWDYYHADEKFYDNMIQKHKNLGFTPVVASGIWTWLQFWYDSRMTEQTARPCIASCLKNRVKEIVFTMWGDDGAYCNYDSALVGLVWAAEKIYKSKIASKLLFARSKCICGLDYESSMHIAQNLNVVHAKGRKDNPIYGVLFASSIIWDDPILGILWNNMKAKNAAYWTGALKHYSKLLKQIESRFNVVDELVAVIIKVIHAKIALRIEIDSAYKRKSKPDLKKMIAKIQAMQRLLRQFDLLFRNQWLKHNKSYGLEVMQIRLAGLTRRYQELAAKLKQFINGEVSIIEEFETGPIDYVDSSFYRRYGQLGVSSWLR